MMDKALERHLKLCWSRYKERYPYDPVVAAAESGRTGDITQLHREFSEFLGMARAPKGMALDTETLARHVILKDIQRKFPTLHPKRSELQRALMEPKRRPLL